MSIRTRQLIVIAICFFIPCLAKGDTTYTYFGNHYTTIENAETPVGVYTTLMSIQGSFTISGPLAPNLTDFTFVPNSWLLSDGRNSFDEYDPNYKPSSMFSVSTDSGGNISGWYLNLETFDAVFTRRIHSAFNTSFASLEEDFGMMVWNSGGIEHTDKGSNSLSHGSWSAVPEPSSPLLLGSLACGLVARFRRRKS